MGTTGEVGAKQLRGVPGSEPLPMTGLTESGDGPQNKFCRRLRPTTGHLRVVVSLENFKYLPFFKVFHTAT